MKLKYVKRAGWLLLLQAGFAHFSQAQTNPVEDMNEVDSLQIISQPLYKDIGYAKQPVKYITSAISTVYGNSIDKNFNLNLGNTLYGRLAGLTVSQGGSEPGAAVPGLTVRGRNTFGDATTGPLYVIDGYISNGIGLANSFMQLLPEEIESISVLKDAAATAVYGARGANGVILVTTKRGNVGPLQVAFSTRQGFSQAQQLPHFLNAYDYARLNNEARLNDGLTPLYTDADLTAYQNGSDPIYHPDVNWYDQVLRKTAPVSSYNLSLNGGDNTVRYQVVLNAIFSQGLFKKFGDLNEESSNSNYARYNFRTNLDVNITKRLSTEFRIAGSVEETNNPNDYTTGNTFNLLANLAPNAFPVYNTNGTFGGSSLYANPVGNLLSTGFYKTNSRTILSSLRFTEQLDMIAKGLSASAAVSINNYFKSGSIKSKQYARYAPFKTLSGNDSATLIPGTQKTSLSGAEQRLDQYRNIIIQAFLNYDRTFGKHAITGMAMFNRDEVNYFGPSGDNTNPTGNSTDPYKHNSGSGRLTYVYDDKYVGELSASYMASNLFPKGKRGGFFYAGSAGWIVSNESFLKKSKAINFLKLRGSYGLVGNDIVVPLGQSTRYSLYTQTFGGGSYVFGTGNANAGGTAEALLANPNLSWEKEKSYNVGLDATIAKNFDISVDVYKRDRYNILVSSASIVPQYLGAISPVLNQGKSNNKGFEASLRYNNTSKKNFRFFIEGNISYTKNKVIYNAEAVQLNTLLYRTGTSIGQPFGYKALGFFTPEEIAQRAIDPKKFPAPLTEVIKAGDIKYQDIGGPEGKPDGIIDGNDVQPIGNPFTPKVIAGLHGGLQVKGFDLDFVLQGASGNTVSLGGNYFNAFQNNGQISEIALGRWTSATAATATYPRLSSKNNLNNYQFSSFFQRDGSFIKLRSVEIGYNLSAKFISRASLKGARIFVTGTNLFSSDKIPYGDPESLTGYPVLRTLTGGVKVNL